MAAAGPVSLCPCCCSRNNRENGDPEQAWDQCPLLGNEISWLCADVFIFTTASALPQHLHTAPGEQYPGIMLNPTNVTCLAVETQGISSSPSWLGGWPLVRGNGCKKIKPSSITKFIYPAVCDFFIWKITLVISKRWKLKFSGFVGFCGGFFWGWINSW